MIRDSAVALTKKSLKAIKNIAPSAVVARLEKTEAFVDSVNDNPEETLEKNLHPVLFQSGKYAVDKAAHAVEFGQRQAAYIYSILDKYLAFLFLLYSQVAAYVIMIWENSKKRALIISDNIIQAGKITGETVQVQLKRGQAYTDSTSKYYYNKGLVMISSVVSREKSD